MIDLKLVLKNIVRLFRVLYTRTFDVLLLIRKLSSPNQVIQAYSIYFNAFVLLTQILENILFEYFQKKLFMQNRLVFLLQCFFPPVQIQDIFIHFWPILALKSLTHILYIYAFIKLFYCFIISVGCSIYLNLLQAIPNC